MTTNATTILCSRRIERYAYRQCWGVQSKYLAIGWEAHAQKRSQRCKLRMVDPDAFVLKPYDFHALKLNIEQLCCLLFHCVLNIEVALGMQKKKESFFDSADSSIRSVGHFACLC